uniref:Adhesion G-protein coupled receptor D1-like n=1 Tax=Phallusia mammillata TaxID=59560 RepID=A0A6F9D6R1_9ASCI|nr:adhesion G-protein coupled receptor D1-like [Phallusia mammillata]
MNLKYKFERDYFSKNAFEATVRKFLGNSVPGTPYFMASQSGSLYCDFNWTKSDNFTECNGNAYVLCKRLEKKWNTCGNFTYINTGNQEIGAGKEICKALNSSLAHLPTCYDLYCFVNMSFPEQFSCEGDTFLPIARQIRHDKSAFQLPPKNFDINKTQILITKELKWDAINTDETFRQVICQRKSEGESVPNKDPDWGRFMCKEPTYCKSADELRELLTGAVKDRAVGDVVSHLEDIAFSFPLTDLRGSVATATRNIETSDLSESIANGIQTQGSVIRSVNATMNGKRLALAYGQATFNQNISKEWLDKNITVPSQNGVIEQNFIAEQDYVLIDVYDPDKEKKVAASVSFSIKPTDIFESLVVPEVTRTAEGKTFYITDAKYRCAYLRPNGTNYSLSTYGCQLMETTVNFTTCACNHTSVFTVMLAVETVFVSDTLEILTYVAQSTSIVFLTITTAALATVRNTINNDRTMVQINLCIALTFMHCISVFNEVFVRNALLCEISTVSLQFFLLSSGFWMLVEGITLSMKTSKSAIKFTSHDPRVVNTVRVLIGWGIPGGVTAAAAILGFRNGSYIAINPAFSVAEQNQMSEWKYLRCWLEPSYFTFWWSVFIPMALVVLVNLVILIRVAVLICTLQKKPTLPLRNGLQIMFVEHLVKVEVLIETAKSLAVLIPALGTSWIFAFFIGLEATSSQVLLYINVVLNGLQGPFLFLIYCVRGEEVRKALNRELEKRGISTTSQSHSRSNTQPDDQ